MSHPTLDYAALSTLNLWLMSDARNHRLLSSGTTSEKLDAISSGASRFRFGRELARVHDVELGLARFQPALQEIDGLTVDEFTENTTESILQTSRKISARYGNENVISATTKLLWMKFRFPIIIFDTRVETALGTKLTHDYYDQWNARYAYYEQSVTEACEALCNALQYVCHPAIATIDYVSELASSTWFRYRVFGQYLYNIDRYA